MGKTVEYADSKPVEMKKKSKKNKIITDDLLHFGDGGGSHVETDGDHIIKKKKRDKHTEKKKRKSELKDEETDGDDLKRDKHREKKRKSESKEDGDEDQHDKVNLQKNKKRKRRSSEKAEVKKNEPGQNVEPDAEKNCVEKKKTDVVNADKKKKKKKIGGKNLDTKESTLKTRDMEDKSEEKLKVKGRRVKNKTTESAENNTEKPKAKSKSKRVSFSVHVEVFPTSDQEREKQATKKDGLVHGKRFTAEEDEIVKQAVFDYINVKGLGDEGLNMVLNCKAHKELIGCWREIAQCIPYRPCQSVYSRAHVLFERCEDRSWAPEEYEILKQLHEEHGNDWKKLSLLLGKHRHHVKDAWRRIKLENFKGGKWSQEECQILYDFVNLDLQLKISGEAEKHSKHGMLRDNVPWTVISEKLTTRSDALCCMKWYRSLTSSLVAEKKWSDADDYRMMGVLYEIDVACAEDVDWDNVLEHRPGEICLKRWNQMVKHIGNYASKSFCEQVDILAKRYRPDLAEIREEWDSKPTVL